MLKRKNITSLKQTSLEKNDDIFYQNTEYNNTIPNIFPIYDLKNVFIYI